LDPSCAAAGRVVLELRRDLLPDALPERVGVDVPLHAPELAALADHAVAEDPLTVADDVRVPLEVDVRPLLLQISLRERALAVQRRLERRDDLRHRRRVGGDGGCGEGALHVRRHATSSGMPAVPL
jgi:hypothetical protein